jgi:hypothetical protein
MGNTLKNVSLYAAISIEEEYEIDNDLNVELVNGVNEQLHNYFDKVNIANQQLVENNLILAKKYDECFKLNKKLEKENKELQLKLSSIESNYKILLRVYEGLIRNYKNNN